MLARTPIEELALSADQLGLTEEERGALIRTFLLLDGGQMVHADRYAISLFDVDAFLTPSNLFHMSAWSRMGDCGTVHCIGGTADSLLGRRAMDWRAERLKDDGRPELHDIFFPKVGGAWDATPEQAAKVLYAYLTTGEERWREVLAA